MESERTCPVFYAGIVVSMRKWTDMLRFPNVNNWLLYYYIPITERIYSDFCIVKRIFYRNQKPLNGYAPFFMAFCGVFSWNERIYSVFQALFKAILAIIVGGLSRSEWVGMLRFRHLMQIAQLPFIVALLNYAFALPGYVYMNAVTGTGATRTTFIFQAVTIIAYQIYLWTISNFSTSLSVYWTAEYLYTRWRN